MRNIRRAALRQTGLTQGRQDFIGKEIDRLLVIWAKLCEGDLVVAEICGSTADDRTDDGRDYFVRDLYPDDPGRPPAGNVSTRRASCTSGPAPEEVAKR